MTKRQRIAADNMTMKFGEMSTAELALAFFEHRFGKVNRHVIEFRKDFVDKRRKDYEKSQDEFEACGGLYATIREMDQVREK